MPEPLKVTVASPDPLVRVVVTVRSAGMSKPEVAVNPVMLLEKVIGTVKVFVVCVPAGSVKLTVTIVVSNAIAFDVVLAAGPVRLPLSVAAFAATASVIVPFAFVGDVTVAV